MRIKTAGKLILVTGVSCCLTLLAGCATTAIDDELAMTMKEHGNDTPVASPMAAYEPAQPVAGKEVIYTTVDGQPIKGWLAKPVNADGALPGLLVIHEWWGLNDNVRRAAERLAGEGYVALAVDLHRGNTADTPKAAMKMGVALGKDEPAAIANLADAHKFLKEQGATKVGTIGWCQGGRWSMSATLAMPEDIAATVVYYGRVPNTREAVANIQSPVLGVFAGEDFIVPPALAYQFAAAMEKEKKDLEFYMYRDAAHAFSNPSGTDYNAEAASDAWKHTTAFLARNLNPQAE